MTGSDHRQPGRPAAHFVASGPYLYLPVDGLHPVGFQDYVLGDKDVEFQSRPYLYGWLQVEVSLRDLLSGLVHILRGPGNRQLGKTWRIKRGPLPSGGNLRPCPQDAPHYYPVHEYCVMVVNARGK